MGRLRGMMGGEDISFNHDGIFECRLHLLGVRGYFNRTAEYHGSNVHCSFFIFVVWKKNKRKAVSRQP